METIIVPVDGASNIKLEVLDFDTLETLFSRVTESPAKELNGLKYNCTAEECSWFDSVIRRLPTKLKRARVIAPVARGASGGLIGADNTLCEVPGQGLTLAYDQSYPDRVEDLFRDIAGGARDFYLETGSIRDFPGSLTLIKRFLFEEIERPGVLKRAAGFGTCGVLLAGHFLGDNYLKAVRAAGNEHSYWMCHSGARNINQAPGTPSSISKKIKSFGRLVPHEPGTVYQPLGNMPAAQASALGLTRPVPVVPGGHDTCLSHIPIMSTFRRSFGEEETASVVHLEAGSWTMVSQIGGKTGLPQDGYKRAVLVQGTVDGHPVVTSLYGGGRDFSYLAGLLEKSGTHFPGELDEPLLERVLGAADCFVLPNINPENHLTGPFPELKGRIINREGFFQDAEKALILANLCVAIATVSQIDAIPANRDLPIVLTAGGSRDPYYGRLIATMTGKKVYALFDRHGCAISETTTLGAAIAGKAACLNIHPYQVDISDLGLSYKQLEPFNPGVGRKLAFYRDRFLEELNKAEH